MEASVTIITDTMMRDKECIADNPPKELLWNNWQYKLLKKITNGVYNAEVLWYYNEKCGKVGKTIFHEQVIKCYEAERYHREIRFLGRMLDELQQTDQYIRAIIVELPYNIDINCRVHCVDALKDIEEYVKMLIPTKTRHPTIIFLSSKRAEKVLGIDFDMSFEILNLREISIPIFSDSLPAEELIHLYSTS